MIPGISIAMSGQDWIVPPLSLGQLRHFLPRVQTLAGLDAGQMGTAQLEMLVDIVTAALQRNYPDVTAEKVEDLLDLTNAVPVLNAILGGARILPAVEPNANGETNSNELPAGPLPEGAEPLHSATLDSPGRLAPSGSPAPYAWPTTIP
jgi:hypothetical protein